MATAPPLTACDRPAALAALHAAIGHCTRCPQLVASRSQVVPGAGNPAARIVFIGEAPGEKEDIQGIPFVGAAGELLNQLLAGIGLAREDVFITNVVKCRPANNRDPEPEEIAECREHIFAQLLLLEPVVVCTLGRFALNTVVHPDLKISQYHGKPVRLHGLTFFPIYHPAAALHDANKREDLVGDFQALRAYLTSVGEAG